MKILAIRGANLASLARDFEIDLSHGALATSGLFAIVGNTGAGKSTLLDAMCVALFDRTPRIGDRQRTPVLIGRGSDDAAKVGAHDVRSLLRRGAGRGYAEVDFSGNDGRVYRARWEVHRARDRAEGALQAQEMSLVALEGGERLGGTKTETLAAIEDKLGLSFDQFRRSALLAQGDFAAFLRADARDRSELLERMTGTEIYSQLSIAAHKRGQAAEARLKELGASLGAIEVLPEAERAALLDELADAQLAHDTARADVAEAERALEWHQRRLHLRQELEQAVRELDKAPTQVLIEASIVEVSLTGNLKYGVEWFIQNSLSGDRTGQALLNMNNSGSIGPQQPGFSYTILNKAGAVRATLNVLAANSQLRVLSNPSVLVLDNHSATILVGKQQPIKQSTTVTTGNLVTESIVYKDTGSAATSPLIAYIDSASSGLPVTPNSGDINVVWSGSGIFSL